MRLSPRPGPRRWVGALALAALVVAAGCGQKTGSVSGKVSYKGAPLKGGNVTFVCSDGKSVMSAIAEDGSYSIDKVPTGPAKVTVETETLGRQSRLPRYSPPKGEEAPGGYKPPDPAEAKKRYVKIPDKYASPDTSGLNYDVKGGSQNFDIKLD